ncbi:DUF2975 domain-containing protein [Legionella sp. km535]|uniref:DUF2975 domain-containing protein n=1 Tax=Legionella sp. km535 TaxID=2498107 RepID=UPI000F8C344C|nr:DUF2975 domain-containing protein [Legionella sp. km535]RUR18062.1 DUF2975 domain-containing protein [Legionella sp. km535]
MHKIKRTSHILSLFFQTLGWALPLGVTYLILFHLETMLQWGAWHSIFSGDLVENPSQISLTHRFIILAIELVPITITVLICRQLARLFRLYEQGALFEKENIKLIKNISIFMILGEFIQLIYQPLITAALTFNNPVGKRLISITLGSTNATTLITAFIILLASWIVKEANRLKTDAQLTI